MPISILLAQTPADLALCYDIRKAVFVEEQAVPLQLELDEYDATATHFLLRDGVMPLATARLLDKQGLGKDRPRCCPARGAWARPGAGAQCRPF